jgi:hypothetical protein
MPAGDRPWTAALCAYVYTRKALCRSSYYLNVSLFTEYYESYGRRFIVNLPDILQPLNQINVSLFGHRSAS